MKLFSEWKKIYIGEARRNPEQNPKVSAYEQLKPYFDIAMNIITDGRHENARLVKTQGTKVCYQL